MIVEAIKVAATMRVFPGGGRDCKVIGCVGAMVGVGVGDGEGVGDAVGATVGDSGAGDAVGEGSADGVAWSDAKRGCSEDVSVGKVPLRKS